MSVRSRLLLAPWPVRLAIGLGGYLLTVWPWLRDPEPALARRMRAEQRAILARASRGEPGSQWRSSG